MRSTTTLLMRLHDVGSRDRGASLVEYALLVALIAMACFAAIGFFGADTTDSFTSSGSSIGAAN